MGEEILVIVGPTASGKTQLAIEVAKRDGREIISADSRQVYAGLNIGTAKPKGAWRDDPHEVDEPDAIDGVEHYLLNVKKPTQEYSLANFKKDAESLIDKIIAKDKKPIVVGGTMLYVDALVNNYEIPEVKADMNLREQLEKQDAKILFEELLRKDPVAKNFIEPDNKRRIIRALEVIETTGKKFSDLRKAREPKYDFKVIGLFDKWEVLKGRITKRAQEMLDLGLVNEIEGLGEVYGKDLPLLRTINYAQQGDLEKMIQANMRYGHRQMSWWKRDKGIEWFTSVADASGIFD